MKLDRRRWAVAVLAIAVVLVLDVLGGGAGCGLAAAKRSKSSGRRGSAAGRAATSSPAGASSSRHGASVASAGAAAALVPGAGMRNGYVTLYTHGQADSAAMLLGVRVMLRSVMYTGTQADLVVLVSPDTPGSVRSMLRHDGFAVKEVHRSDRMEGMRWNELSAQCPRNMDFVHLWTLTDYDRLVFLEPSVLVFLNMDDLFKCGHFCMQYTSLLHWLGSVLVLKPDMKEFQRLVETFSGYSAQLFPGVSAHEQHHQQLWPFRPRRANCAVEHGNFLLEAWPDMEAAAWFEAGMYKPNKPAEDPTMRFSIIYAVNAIFYYEQFTWRRYTHNLKIPEGSSGHRTINLLPNNHHNVTNLAALMTSPPTFSIAFEGVLPYYWFEASYFTLNWHWHEIMAMFLPDEAREEAWRVIWTRVALMCLLWVTFQQIQKHVFTMRFREWAVLSSEALRSRLPSTAAKANVAGVLVGIAVVVMGAMFCRSIIPRHTAPGAAWPLFVLYHGFFVYVALVVMWNVLPPRGFTDPPSPKTLIVAGIMQLFMILLLRMDIYNYIATKIAILFFMVAVSVVTQARGFRHIFLAHVQDAGKPTERRQD